MSEENNIVVPKEDMQLSDNAGINHILSQILRGEGHLSYSALSAFMEGPKEFIKYKLKTRETTDAMQYGGMLHCLVLEPEDFYNRYFVLDDEQKVKEIGGGNPRSTKLYKDWKIEMLKNAGGKELVSTANHRMASQIAIDVRFNEASRRILDICPRREQELLWSYGNYKWKAYKDLDGDDSIADLKSCPDANVDDFQRKVYYEKLYLQGYMYLYGDSVAAGEPRTHSFRKDFYWIAVDQKGGISCHQMGKGMIERGRREYEFYTNKFSECILSDSFDKSYEFFAQRRDGIYDCDRSL